MARAGAWRACVGSPGELGLLMRAGRGGLVDLGPARRSRDRAFQPVRLGQLDRSARDRRRSVRAGGRSAGATSTTESPPTSQAPTQSPCSSARCQIRGSVERERVADRRVDRPAVAGQEDLDLAGEPADCDHVVPVPGCVGGADDEDARLPQDHERVAPLAGERVGLDPPPSRGQLREPGPELGRRELEPALEIDEPAERFERVGRKDAGPRGVTRERPSSPMWPLRTAAGPAGRPAVPPPVARPADAVGPPLVRRRRQRRTRITGAARTTIHHTSSPIISGAVTVARSIIADLRKRDRPVASAGAGQSSSPRTYLRSRQVPADGQDLTRRRF